MATRTTELLQRLGRNDPTVAQELYKHIEARLKAKTAQRVCRSLPLAGRVAPSDVLQSVFIRLLEMKLPPDLRSGTGFLLAIVRDRVAHRARAFVGPTRDRGKEDGSAATRAGLAAKGPSASKIACDAEEAELAQRVIQEMSAADRTVVTLHLEGKSWKEIGSQLGTKADAARKRYCAAMCRLRAKLGVEI